MQNLETFLTEKNINSDLILIFKYLAIAGSELQKYLHQAYFENLLGSEHYVNIQGEIQQKMDLKAEQLFEQAVKKCEKISVLVSEERPEPIFFDEKKEYLLFMDPLDGSSNLEVNGNVGSIFSLYRRQSSNSENIQPSDLLQKADQQVAAAYILYGPATVLVLSFGEETYGFTLKEDGVFYQSHHFIFPEKPTIYAINQAQEPYWDDFTKTKIAHYQKTCNARYSGALVADFHRILCKGGVFAYPTTSFVPQGKLRFLYECAPLALIAKGAKAVAHDGKNEILNHKPEQIHERSGFWVEKKLNL